jgi:hypothetical protein
MRKKSTFRLLAAGLFVTAALVTQAAAQEIQETSPDGDVVVYRIPVPLPMAPAAATTPALEMSLVTVGMQVSGFPCFGGDTGCGDTAAGTVAAPIPLAFVPAFLRPGSTATGVTYTVVFEDWGYTGACSAAYNLKQGTTTIAGQSYTFSGGCASGNVYAAAFNAAIPDKPGATKLTGSFTAGTNKGAAVLNITILP